MDDAQRKHVVGHGTVTPESDAHGRTIRLEHVTMSRPAMQDARRHAQMVGALRLELDDAGRFYLEADPLLLGVLDTRALAKLSATLRDKRG